MKNSLNLAVAVIFLVVLGCSCPSKLKELSEKNTRPTPVSTPGGFSTSETPYTVPKGDYDVTMDKYNQISIG